MLTLHMLIFPSAFLTFCYDEVGSIFLVLALLQCSFAESQAQFITGEVRDYATDEPVPVVRVYFNSSVRGTTTDQDGNFQLATKDFECQHIVVSCVSYESWTLKEWQEDKTYRIYLKPSSNILKELYIVARDIPRQRKEEMFLREFLGTTKNGLSCMIENLEDVDLVYLHRSKTLEGYIDKPLIIRNKSLGYKIRYYLD